METQFATHNKEAQKQFATYLRNPQRWNRYPYALNNPLFYTDPTGEDVTIYYRSVEEGKDVGHIFIYVRNDETGESAYFDYVPLDDDTALLPVGQRRIDNHASLTIETTPEQEQAILDGIKDMQNNLPDWKYLTPNCVSKSEDLLNLGGIDVGSSILPVGMWREAVQKYGNDDAKGTEAQNWPSLGNPRTYNPGVSSNCPIASPALSARGPRKAVELEVPAAPFFDCHPNAMRLESFFANRPQDAR
jgi:hypothetical protein